MINFEVLWKQQITQAHMFESRYIIYWSSGEQLCLPVLRGYTGEGAATHHVYAAFTCFRKY